MMASYSFAAARVSACGAGARLVDDKRGLAKTPR